MSSDKISIPVIDIFAGPGGLGEGFGRLYRGGRRAFRSALSIEKDSFAHRTLTLRAFYRQFHPGAVPSSYFDHLRGAITTGELFDKHPREADAARAETWHAELGSNQLSLDRVRDRVSAALQESEDWVLLGGPPCQAYSLAGRSRNRGIAGYRFEDDRKSTLYLEYLQLISDFWPAVFVMENVKGLLSAKLNGSSMFARICDDLADPAAAITRESRSVRDPRQRHRYDLYPIVAGDGRLQSFTAADPANFVVRAERYGIPQARHRVILVGVRRGFVARGPEPITPLGRSVTVREAIADLPPLRSGLSRSEDSPAEWAMTLEQLGQKSWQDRLATDGRGDVARRVADVAFNVTRLAARPRYVKQMQPCIQYRRDWFEAGIMPLITNHESRTHMSSDLRRYLFAAAFAEVRQRSPGLSDFPRSLLPDHGNAYGVQRELPFADRFRVQCYDRPSTTITSHISRDGHYYIHPDPEQCRSLTVREAARLQSFPDTYFFEGNRTQQYIQVGNAVPPLLAHQIAERVYDLFT